MAKEITDLVEATVLNDADFIVARQGSEDKKALLSTLIDKVNLGLPVADTSNRGIVDKELILQLLLLVDGSGSGLDSDLLDGEEGSFYQNADNLNAGTVPTSRLPSSTTTQKGVIQTATNSEVIDGTETTKAVPSSGITALFSGNQSSLAATGFQKLPGGLILQWGSVNYTTSGLTNKVYATPFQSAVFSLTATSATSTGLNPDSLYTTNRTLTDFDIGVTGDSGGTAFWMAVGL